jgi:hypothetical protein
VPLIVKSRHHRLPVVRAFVAGPSGSLLANEALLDSGAERSVLPLDLAEAMGLAETLQPAGSLVVVGARLPLVRTAHRVQAALRTADGAMWGEPVRLDARFVDFSEVEDPPPYWILGHDFISSYRVTLQWPHVMVGPREPIDAVPI